MVMLFHQTETFSLSLWRIKQSTLVEIGILLHLNNSSFNNFKKLLRVSGLTIARSALFAHFLHVFTVLLIEVSSFLPLRKKFRRRVLFFVRHLANSADLNQQVFGNCRRYFLVNSS